MKMYAVLMAAEPSGNEHAIVEVPPSPITLPFIVWNRSVYRFDRPPTGAWADSGQVVGVYRQVFALWL